MANNNVIFKKGTQSQLQTLIRDNSSGIVDGAFYLTEDTNRLYIGHNKENSTAKLNLLNQTVQMIDSWDTKPNLNSVEVNDFYYCIKENVLMVCCLVKTNGTEVKQWRQINPDTDTNTNTYVTEVKDYSVSVNENKDIEISFNLCQIEKNHITNDETKKDPIEIGFTIKKADLDKANAINIGLKAEQDGSNGCKISTNGDGSNPNDYVKIKTTGAGLTFDETKKEITITGTTYDISAKDNKIILTDNLKNIDEIKLESDDIVSLASAEDKITVSHANFSQKLDASEKTLSSTEEDEFSVIEGFSTEKGHITGYKKNTIKVPKPHINNKISISAGESGSLSISLTDNYDNTVNNTASEALFYKVGKNGQHTVYNGTSLGVYTISEIDSLFKGLDAMTYKGTVGQGAGATIDSLPRYNVQNGDTYKVCSEGTFGTYNCRVGDLLIASGTEGSDGYLTDFQWTYVPSGNEDTTYSLSFDRKDLVLTANPGGETSRLGFEEGTSIGITQTTDPNSNKSSLKFSHADIACVDNSDNNVVPLSPGNEITFLNDIGVNNQGHVTEYKKIKAKLPTYNVLVGKDNSNNAKIILRDNSSNETGATIKNNDKYLNISTTNNNEIIIDHKTDTVQATELSEPNNLSSESIFSAITAISVDSARHLSEYQVTKFALPHIETYQLTREISATNNVASLKALLNGSTGSQSNALFKLSSENLKITSKNTGNDTDTISIDLVWESF